MISQNYQQELINKIRTDSNLSKVFRDLIKENEENSKKQKSLEARCKNEAATCEFREDKQPMEYDGVPIFQRSMKNELKVNHRLHHPFARKIMLKKTGYMAENVKITIDEKKYNENELTVINDKIKEFCRVNSWEVLNEDLVSDCTSMGRSYVLLYKLVDELEIRAKTLNPYETIIIKNASTDIPDYAMRYWDIQIVKDSKSERRTYVEWYDKERVYFYIEDGYGNFELIKETYPDGSIPHLMSGVPIIEFLNAKDGEGDVEQTLSQQDAYNVSLSDLSGELAQLRLSYLANRSPDVSGHNIDDALLEKLKKTGMLIGDWAFIDKNVNIEAVQFLLTLLRKNIYDGSNSVDFNSEELSGNLPIIAIKLKLEDLESSSKMTENQFIKSYRYMFDLLLQYWKQYRSFPDLKIQDINFIFNRNIPQNETEMISNFNSSGGKISQKTMLSNHPWVKDVDAEQEQIDTEEKENTEEVNIDENGNPINPGKGNNQSNRQDKNGQE